jgi:RNA polymerase sigma-70 factor (ECF subfamily)
MIEVLPDRNGHDELPVAKFPDVAEPVSYTDAPLDASDTILTNPGSSADYYETPSRTTTVTAEVFSAAYVTHAGPMRQRILDIVHNPSTADEIVQEAFTRGWKNRASCRGGLSPWLYSIARNAALDYLRRAVNRELPNGFQTEAEVLPFFSNPNQGTEAAVIGSILFSQALACLKPHESMTLRAIHEGGMTLQDYADSIGRPLGTVKYWASHGQRQLREMILANEVSLG